MRDDYINWQTYFIGIAYLSALRSKDPITQVGACIVNDKNRIVGIGYNGFPQGCADDEFPWGKADNLLDSKHAYVVHAELNAILNAQSNVDGCALYVTHFPCHECAKAIVQSGIREVFFASDAREGKPTTIAAKKIFEAANVGYTKISEYKLTIESEEKCENR